MKPTLSHLHIYVVLVLPTVIDGTTQLIGDRTSTNLLRALTGLPAGIGIMFIIRSLTYI